MATWPRRKSLIVRICPQIGPQGRGYRLASSDLELDLRFCAGSGPHEGGDQWMCFSFQDAAFGLIESRHEERMFRQFNRANSTRFVGCADSHGASREQAFKLRIHGKVTIECC